MPRRNVTGENRLRINYSKLVPDIENAVTELGTQHAVAQKVGVHFTTISSLLSARKQDSMFEGLHRTFEKAFDRPEGYYVKKGNPRIHRHKSVKRKAHAKRVVHNLNGAVSHENDDAVMMTVEYFRAMRAQPVPEQARAQRLLEFLMKG